MKPLTLFGVSGGVWMGIFWTVLLLAGVVAIVGAVLWVPIMAVGVFGLLLDAVLAVTFIVKNVDRAIKEDKCSF